MPRPVELVVLVPDGPWLEEPTPEKSLRTPRLVMSAPPEGDSGAVAEAAKLLVNAENPVIVAGRVARSPKGIEHLVELADVLQARVQDQRMRMNFPSAHPLYGHPGAGIATPNLTDHDVILSLEAQDLWGITHKMTGFNKFGMESQPTIKAGAKVITVSAIELNHQSNYQDFGRYVEAALAITGHPQATLPQLLEAFKQLSTPDP